MPTTPDHSSALADTIRRLLASLLGGKADPAMGADGRLPSSFHGSGSLADGMVGNGGQLPSSFHGSGSLADGLVGNGPAPVLSSPIPQGFGPSGPAPRGGPAHYPQLDGQPPAAAPVDPNQQLADLVAQLVGPAPTIDRGSILAPFDAATGNVERLAGLSTEQIAAAEAQLRDALAQRTAQSGQLNAQGQAQLGTDLAAVTGQRDAAVNPLLADAQAQGLDVSPLALQAQLGSQALTDQGATQKAFADRMALVQGNSNQGRTADADVMMEAARRQLEGSRSNALLDISSQRAGAESEIAQRQSAATDAYQARVADVTAAVSKMLEQGSAPDAINAQISAYEGRQDPFATTASAYLSQLGEGSATQEEVVAALSRKTWAEEFASQYGVDEDTAESYRKQMLQVIQRVLADKTKASAAQPQLDITKLFAK